MRFGHIALRVKNIDRMLDFYCQKMGFEEAFRINNDDSTLRIVYVHISDFQYIELCLGGENKKAFDDKLDLGFRHVSFTVDDLVKTKKDLEQKGVVLDSEVLNMRDNNLAAFLFDPEGNKIELVEIKSDSPHFKFENSKKV